MSIQDKAIEIAGRIKRGEQITIGDAVYDLSRVRRRCREYPSYHAALWLAQKARTTSVRIESRKIAKSIFDRCLMIEAYDAAADLVCGLAETPHYVQEQTA